MAIAAWMVWRERGLSAALIPLALFGLQLFLNCAWSGLFFALHKPWLAFADIVVLWFAIVATMVSFSRVSSFAGILLAPYLLWVTFAAMLNFTVARMNP
jgi:tryptophan-rich sensory protein